MIYRSLLICKERYAFMNLSITKKYQNPVNLLEQVSEKRTTLFYTM